MFRAFRKTKQQGLTLAESLMVIAVGSVAIVSGTLLFQNAMTAMRLQDAVTGLQTIRSQVSTLYSTRTDIGDHPGRDITDVLVQGGQMPANMVYNGRLRNAWDGNVQIIAQGLEYEVLYTGLPGPICVQLFARSVTVSSENSKGVVLIAINNNTFTPPFDPAMAAQNCQEWNNFLLWRFRK